MPEQNTSGLAGVVAGEAAICDIGRAGAGLSYRGYSIYDLAEHATFEEVAYLLIYGRLPDREELAKYKIMGFGHRIYKREGPRTDIIKEWSRKLSEASGDITKFRISEWIEEIMLKGKALYPNLDFYSATTYHFGGIPESMFKAIFAMARISGWSAHIIEQRKENRLIRPSADYIGPGPRTYVPLEDRR